MFASVAEQAKQLLPLVPHCCSEGWTQLEPVQHPLGHDRASQRHCPLTQCCPELQAGCAPQLQVPSALHVSVVMLAHE